MNLHDLSKATTKNRKRLGRGLGSGKGKTGGRGTKGQKARGKVPNGFIGGGTLALYKKLPMARGRGGRGGKNMLSRSNSLPIKLEVLNSFKDGQNVTVESLIEQGVVTATEAKKRGVKIVGSADLKVKLKISLPVTKSARESIEKAGGQIV